MCKKRHIATEQQRFEEILEALPSQKRWAEAIFSRLKCIVELPDQARVVDIGAGAGGFLIACKELGFCCQGIEPWGEARRNAMKLSEYLSIPIYIVGGNAEFIPFSESTFDVVHASNLIEHVSNVEKSFKEIYRVLKPGGVFWFNSASSMCPRQEEIRGFPLFGWYPDSLKQKIMNWSKDNRPHLVGYTRTPAINWFTPSKARRLLQKQGFGRIYDRWDLRRETEDSGVYGLALRVMRSTRFTKTLGDIIIAGCSYAAVK